MTSWSLEPIVMSRCWVSSLLMLCQVFTAAVFSSWIFLGHFAFSFTFSKWNVCNIEFRLGDWGGHCRTFHFSPFKKKKRKRGGKRYWVAFEVCFGSLSICTVKCCSVSFETFGWIWAENITLYTSEFILLYLSAVAFNLVHLFLFV